MQPAARRSAGERVVAGIGQLGHVGADESIGRQRGGDPVEDRLVQRLQRRVCRADLRAQARHPRGGRRGVAGLLRQARQQRLKGLPGIAPERYGRGIEVVELARVDIDADQFAGQRQAFAPEVGVGHLGAHRQHQIGLGDHLPARRYAQAGPGVERRVRRQQALAGDAGEQRRGQALAQRGKRIAGRQRAAAGDEHWSPGRSQALRRRPQCLGARHTTTRAARHGSAPVMGHRRGKHVERDRDMHRARTLAVEHRVGPGDQFGQLFRAQGQGGEGSDRRGHGTLVLGLVQAAPALAQAGAVVDAGNHQQRHRVGVGLADGGGDVGHARPGDDEAHSRLAADPRITVGHEAGALLVAGQHVADAAARKSAVQLQGMHAGDAENGIHAVVGQQADQGLAGGEGLLWLHGQYPRPVRRPSESPFAPQRSCSHSHKREGSRRVPGLQPLASRINASTASAPRHPPATD